MANPAPQPDAFLSWVTQLVHAHRAGLLGIARGEGLEAEDALDVVQEAFFAFLLLPQARALVEVPDDSAKLLTVLAKNSARNRRRRRYRSVPHTSDAAALEALAADAPNADELVGQAEDHVRLLGCVNQLGDAQRKIVVLRLLDEVPGEDVAALLGITPSHVAVLLHRAKHSLRVCMECSE